MKQRKPARFPKPRTVKFRVSAADYERFCTAAEASGITLSEWVRLRVSGKALIEAVPPSKVA